MWLSKTKIFVLFLSKTFVNALFNVLLCILRVVWLGSTLCLNLEPLFSHLQKGDYKIHITRLCRIKNYSLQESIEHNIPHIVGIA